MPVNTYWEDDTQQIMRYDLLGSWTWDEFYPEYHKAIARIKSAPYRVDSIIDATKSVGTPTNVLSHIRSITDKRPENVRLSVIVSTNKVLLTLFEVGCRFYPKIKRTFFFVSTVEEAHRMIALDRDRTTFKTE